MFQRVVGASTLKPFKLTTINCGIYKKKKKLCIEIGEGKYANTLWASEL